MPFYIIVYVLCQAYIRKIILSPLYPFVSVPHTLCPCLCPLRDLYTEAHVGDLLVQILSAVDYLHSRRVIHLDLKSDNMLVDDGNHLKIVDLGSAQSFTPGQPLNIEHIHGMSESKGTDVFVAQV